MAITVVAGLGNPGPQYSNTRHNFGFLLADRLAGRVSWRSGPGIDYCRARVGANDVWLVKPLQFMNRSGDPLQRFMAFHKVPIEGLAVLHDDLDVSRGLIRLKHGGGDGGHNGLKSITSALGSGEYFRVRLGIGRPPEVTPGYRIPVVDWVLGRFDAIENNDVERVLSAAPGIVQILVESGLAAAQGVAHRS
jgi:peptidyl-tRNA hydrolase, PTH1 family